VKRGHVLLINFLVMLMFAFNFTAINVALPDIQKELRLGAVALGWLPLAYILASAVFLLPFGKIGDRFGRRMVFLTGLVIFLLSTVALVFADSYAMLVALRAAQGIAASMVFTMSVAMVTLTYPPEKRGLAMGISVAAVYLGQTAGPAIGGVIIQYVGWRNLFLATACFAFANLALDVWLLRKAEWKESEPSGFDWTGSGVYAVALSAFLLGLSWVPALRGVIILVAGVLGIVFFVWWEARAQAPVMPVHLFRRNRVFAFSNLTALIFYSSISAMTFLMPVYLQFIREWSPRKVGLVLVSGLALQCLISPFSGRLADRVDPRWIASGGMLLCVVGLSMFTLLQTTTPIWYIVLALCFLGLGYGIFSGPNQSSIMGSVERRHIGLASASISTARTVGMAIGVALATFVMSVIVGNHEIKPADYPALLNAVRISFALFTGLCALAVVVSLARGNMPVLASQTESLGAEPAASTAPASGNAPVGRRHP
jgi:EmrB/QacA subfamily drug resistance transporter